MIVSEIKLENFMVHDSTTLRLPARGVVVLTGANGHGKSTLVEGVSWALGGQTLRGSSPWRRGVAGSCAVTGGALQLVRSVTKGGAKRFRAFEGEAELQADTATKLSALVESRVGSWELWRRTHVFSAADAAHFSQATDKQRKQLIEQMLGLDRTDRALDWIKAQRAETQARIAALGLDHLQARLTQAQAQLEAWQPLFALELPPEPEAPLVARPSPEELEAAQQAADALAAKDPRLADVAVARAQAAVAQWHAQLSALPEAVAEGACPACGGPVTESPDEHAARIAQREALAGKLSAARIELARANAARSAIPESWAADLHAANQLLSTLSRLRDEWARYDRALQNAEAFRQRAEARYAAQAAAHEKLRESLAAARLAAADQLQFAREEAEDLGAHERDLAVARKAIVLTRGTVLGRALRGIEAAANARLARLCSVRVELSATSTTKAGAESDAIGLQLHGLAHTEGYTGASAGERRRADLALLISLAEVSAGCLGRELGTLWLDEIFDSLDADGFAAVADLITDLARERCVVVITHRDASQLAGARVYRVAQGRLSA